MFAGKKSAQIREILISESAWEEMTCLFAPSLMYAYISINDEGEEQQWQSTHLFFGFLNFRLIKPLYPFNFCQRCGPV
ncbi:hypothetical protein DCT63_07135 [Salmonella enterica]|nr:hypothetical protein [Salmonella enterica]EBD8620233.1 hypothetical protein [Salmonella enterica]EBE9242656.1 hypothetical protein [Salmonella enterica]EBE9245111.1 hypothetical protein [Salmonella enterica]EBE9279382.1 hypothetical protein [Salmonella enterica]